MNYENTKEYKIISETIQFLWNEGIIQRANGSCIGISDMLQTLLKTKGIDSNLIECKLSLLSKNPVSLTLIGHLNNSKGNIVNKEYVHTHIVVVTKTETPFLIDLSIMGLHSEVNYIFRPCENQTEHILLKLDLEESVWTYEEVNLSKLPKLHQKSLVERITTDLEIYKNFKLLNILFYIAITFGAINFGLNIYTIYLTNQQFSYLNRIKQHDN